MKMSLRKAVPADYDAVGQLASALVGFEADRRAAFDALLASPDHDLIVAAEEGALVGWAHLLTHEDLSHGALAGELLGLVVRQDLRKRGIGTALLREVCRLAKERGAHELHVNTERDNDAARRLYERLGAEIVGVQLEISLERP